MSRADALSYLKKQVKEALDFDHSIQGITTGSIAIDKATGIGGWPRGRVSEVFGWESSGKSTLCLTSCAMAQRKGFYPVYLDPERGIDLSYATRLGFNWEDDSKGLYATPFSFEETTLIIHKMAEEGECDLIIVDSVPGMVPKKILEGDPDEFNNAIGLQSRMLAQFLSKITKVIAERNIALVFVNQMRAKINTGPGAQWEPKEQASGGSAIKFYSSLRINLDNVKKIREKRVNQVTGDEEDMPVANLHRAVCFKNKVSMPYKVCEFYVRYDPLPGVPLGIDNLSTIIDMAVANGVVLKKGAGFFEYSNETTKNNFNIRGTNELYFFLLQNKEILKEIRESLKI